MEDFFDREQETSSTSEETESDKESGVTQIEVRTTTTTTTMTTFSGNKMAAPGGAAAAAAEITATMLRRANGSEVEDDTYLRMDRPRETRMEEDTTSDITVEDEKEEEGERPTEIDASTER